MMQVQVPSPMHDNIRKHERVQKEAMKGRKLVINHLFSQPVVLYLPQKAVGLKELGLIVHFNGAAHIPMKAVEGLERPMALAVVNEGWGSSVYKKAFEDPMAFQKLIGAVKTSFALSRVEKIYVTSFSAGYGAVREILKSDFDRIDGLLLLDGLHADYIPENTRLAEGGKIDPGQLGGFLNYAKEAVAGHRKMLITHSEIFPGTYASTTETADWLLAGLSLKRNPVLAEGPVGMQQLSSTEKGRLRVWAYAGNTGPDHMDHLHGLPHFLKVLLEN